MKQQLKQIIQERKNKILTRQKYIQKQFERANTGALKMDGVRKLAAQIENNSVRFAGFPSWVLATYMDPAKHCAIPLKNNRWLDVQNIVNSTGDIDPSEITYGGFVVDGERNRESGIKTLNIVRSEDVDIERYAKLLLFKRAVNEAKTIIEAKNKRDMLMNNGMPQEATGGMTPPPPEPEAGQEAPQNSIEPTSETPEDNMAGTGGEEENTGDEGGGERIDLQTGLKRPPAH